jgi:hypothetical protein
LEEKVLLLERKLNGVIQEATDEVAGKLFHFFSLKSIS